MSNDWKITELIEALGGVQSLPAKFAKIGMLAPPTETMVGWRKRSSAPCGWTLALVQIAQSEGLITFVDKLRRDP